MGRYNNMTTVAAWVSDDTLEELELYRWGNRLSRSEFIRQSIDIHLELIRRARVEQRHQHKSK